MFGLGIWELLIILAIILIVFGPKRLKNIGADLGSAIKGFRTAIKEEEVPETAPAEKVIEGEARSAAHENAAGEHASEDTKSNTNV